MTTMLHPRLRCPVKGCAFSALYPENDARRVGWVGNVEYSSTSLEVWRWERNRENGEAVRDYFRCPDHGRNLRRFVVEGRVAEAVRCDVRCVSARGRKCECSCGGENHGV